MTRPNLIPRSAAARRKWRLRYLLNQNSLTVVTGGLDHIGKRTLATIRIGGRDVGDILIDEGLGRRWPDGHEWREASAHLVFSVASEIFKRTENKSK